MKNIVNAPFVEEMRKTTANMYRLGWDERNGGNISCLLDTDKVAEYLDINEVKRTIPLGFDADPLIGKGNFPFPPPAQLQNYIYGGVTNDNLTKGVKGVLDMNLVGFIFGHGNSPSL